MSLANNSQDNSYSRTLNKSYWSPVCDSDIQRESIGQRLDEAARDSKNSLALTEVTIEGNVARKWTYVELQSDARRLAEILVNRHPPRSNIAIWGNNIPEWVLLEYAAAYAGLTIVTVNPSFQLREAKYIVEQSESTAIYYVPSVRGNPIEAIAKEIKSELPQVQSIIDMTCIEELYKRSSEMAVLPEVESNDPAQIQYTSGTTGMPKGVLLHHMGLAENARFHAERGGMRKGDVIMNVMPLFHTAGCAVLTLGPLAARATVVLFAQFDPEHTLKAIESEGITCVFGVPTMLTALVDVQKTLGCDMSTVKNVIAGGAMVAPEMVRAAKKTFDAEFQIIFGQTETSPVLTMVWDSDEIEDVTESVGQPLPHVELAVLDTETGQTLAVNEVGEVCARGPMNMLGYFRQKEATAKTIDKEQWLHTGDLGMLDNRGYLHISGRLKEMIIRGGENLFPAEIENTMLEHSDLVEVAVVGIPDEKFGEVVACFFRSTPGAALTRSDLVIFCRERISAQKMPAIWVGVSDWPLTGSGKIQKFMLREKYVNGDYIDAVIQ
ncbi:fatty-acyl-CoA synthase [Zhongshania antarctica]|uniref:Fatty-acyl-CoA synthase n=1 Tax=Zhongshania antarctica TaxID=641702 RepID=A0A840R8T6_9GAMM|nr:AMP-binding protein [Zhongshania antarctica]MBB5189014.1 fatty-acyl-CoA synthase [Zhongshania antarctica]